MCAQIKFEKRPDQKLYPIALIGTIGYKLQKLKIFCAVTNHLHEYFHLFLMHTWIRVYVPHAPLTKISDINNCDGK